MLWPRRDLADLLGIEHPIIQAPMAGASTAALAAAVSNAGALGGFGGTDSSPDELRAVLLARCQGSLRAALEVEIAPGGSAARHRHAGSQYVHVLSGSIRSQLNDGPVVVYQAGQSWIEPAGVAHSLAENASKTEPVKLLAVFIAPTGAELTTVEK